MIYNDIITNKKQYCLILRSFSCLFIWLLFYFYQNPVKFVFFPVGSLFGLACIGFFCFCAFLAINKKTHCKTISLIFRVSCFLTLFECLLAMITSLVNCNLDLVFFKAVSFVLLESYFGFFLIVLLINITKLKFDVSSIPFFYSSLLVVRLAIGLLFFCLPNAYSVISSIIDITQSAERLTKIRLISIGNIYFGAGVNNSFTLLLIAFFISRFSYSKQKLYILIFNWLFIAFCGCFESRTTLVGILICIIYYLYLYFYKRMMKILEIAKKYFMISLIFITTIFCFSSFFNMNRLINFGFEMFINYMNDPSSGLRTKSTDEMATLYILPDYDDYKTWLIGDAKFFLNNGLYYMHTDIGYCRLIFYYGLFGFFVHLFNFNALLYYFSKLTEHKYKELYVLILILFLVLSLKGITVLYSFIMPLMFLSLGNDNKLNNSKYIYL